MDAYGFPWCAFGRAPDVESMENEFPMLIPLSSHWRDSGGAGKYRGGVGTAQLWVSHHVPMVFAMAIADNSTVQTPQPLFGGYAQPTVPGIVLDDVNVTEALASAEASELTLEGLLNGSFGGHPRASTYGSAIHPVPNGETVIIGLSTGGTGYGDCLDRDPRAVVRDVVKNLVSESVARDIYGVVLDKHGHLGEQATADRRAELVSQRLSRGKPYDEFVAEWSLRKPDEAILTRFGSWPDGAVLEPLVRP
jgi:N-methylhydantoinase B/oxoprolinase/acetone carboxylase alpha subunit